jgi:hypothetical protein
MTANLSVSASDTVFTPVKVKNTQAPLPKQKVDFSKLSLGAKDLFRDGEINIMLQENRKSFDDVRNIVPTDARGGSDLKYHNIATFSIGKNNRLAKENKPTLFGEKVLNELTGIRLAK